MALFCKKCTFFNGRKKGILVPFPHIVNSGEKDFLALLIPVNVVISKVDGLVCKLHAKDFFKKKSYVYIYSYTFSPRSILNTAGSLLFGEKRFSHQL